MSTEDRERRPNQRRRKRTLIVVALGTLLLFAAIFSEAAFRLKFLQPSTSDQTLVFTALSALIFLLLVALSFVLLRNLLKLYGERRLGVLGAKFRTRMVLAALLLSITPVIFLFLFAYGLMNRSIDRWFSQPAEELRENSAAVASLLGSYASQNAAAEAASIAATPETQKAFRNGKFSAVVKEFHRREATLQGGFALALLEGELVAGVRAPEPWARLRLKLPLDATTAESSRFRLNTGYYVLGSAPVGPRGNIVVAMPLPENYSSALNRLEQSQQKYLALHRDQKLLRRTYMGMLSLLTVLVLFAATWFALFLSRLVTRPVDALAQATREISRGRLDYRVEVAAADEFGELVRSFNKMAAELEASRTQIENAGRELADANVELEQRRRRMETVLESIPTGVLSLGPNRLITHANDAFRRIFALSTRTAVPEEGPGMRLREIFSNEVVTELERLLRKADRMGVSSQQMEVAAQRGKLTLAVTAASLRHEGQRLGSVLVFEDLSDLLRAQKQAAWREVARRVAHEIKNPLTPIALSAERIGRHLERGLPPDEESLEVIRSCATTIGTAIETVRTLVDQFSTLARFPTAQPQPADINSIVESALAMFNGRLEGVHISTSLDPALPRVMADAEGVKRALANLVDNAVEAMQKSLLKEVHISTALADSGDMVEVAVADSGQGVSRELKEKLFLPYFSTKARGTGLGLAIVSRIVEDHHGSIRVEENVPLGARFVIELPVASANGAVASAAAAHA